jgi:hypothetical protein
MGKIKNKHKKGNDDKRVLYAVLKLNTDIEVTNPLTGKQEDTKLCGIAGYIPVFETIEEAIKEAQNGKYQIAPITA